MGPEKKAERCIFLTIAPSNAVPNLSRQAVPEMEGKSESRMVEQRGRGRVHLDGKKQVEDADWNPR